jgi:hypothetical protein
MPFEMIASVAEGRNNQAHGSGIWRIWLKSSDSSVNIVAVRLCLITQELNG